MKTKACIKSSELFRWNDRKGLRKTEEGDSTCFEVDNPDNIYSSSLYGKDKFVEYDSGGSSASARLLTSAKVWSRSAPRPRRSLETELEEQCKLSFDYVYPVLRHSEDLVFISKKTNPTEDPAQDPAEESLGLFLLTGTGECAYTDKVKFMVPDVPYCSMANANLITVGKYIELVKQLGEICYFGATVNYNGVTVQYQYPSGVDDSNIETTDQVTSAKYEIVVNNESYIDNITITLEGRTASSADGNTFVRNNVTFVVGTLTRTEGAPGYTKNSTIMLKAGSTLETTCSVSDGRLCVLVENDGRTFELSVLQFGVNRVMNQADNSFINAVCAITEVAAFANSAETVQILGDNCPTGGNYSTTKRIHLVFLTSQMGKPGRYQKYIMGVNRTIRLKELVTITAAETENAGTTLSFRFVEYIPQQLKEQRREGRRSPFYDFFYPFVQKEEAYAQGFSRSCLILSFLLIIVMIL
eukprot:TRINITY_DN6428_c0_g2_i3.p1 TRINITY_DN6428_c0_g2~~TRINITY_DN6428_c0_g2_i3.p1  ORF type:complete len:470 (+),score=62.80 TRINITY_DN6428_c0_g2_i3:428-1837(+)